MIDPYYWPTPNGHKITLFCEEASVPYRIVPVNIAKGDRFDPWIVPYERQRQRLEDFPNVKRWFESIAARPATARAYAKANGLS